MGFFDRFKKKNKEPKKPTENTKDLPENLKKYNLRVSTPYGVYPEDIDELVKRLETQVSQLTKENTRIEKLYSETKKERDNARTELTRIKMQISLMEVPDTSAEEDFHMLGRLQTINPNVGSLPEEKLEEKPEVDQEVFDDLVSKPTETVGIDVIEDDDNDVIAESNKKKNTTISLDIIDGD